MSFGTTTLTAQRPMMASDASLQLPRSGGFRKVAARRHDGSLICLSDLPEPDTRWTRLRKRAVIECLDNGLIEMKPICERYDLTRSEIAEWRAAVADNGRAPVLWRDRPRHKLAGEVVCGAISINLDNSVVRCNGTEIALSPSEQRILFALAEANGAVVTSAMIMGVLYDRVEEAAVPKIADVLICRLRKKLGTQGDRVAAVWGRGYRLDF